MRRVLSRTVSAIALALWSLIWIELGLQGYYYATAHEFLFNRTAIAIFVPNKFCGFFNKPNLSYSHRTNEYDITIYTNSEGFRVARPGVEYSTARTPGTFRILLLGPSFAFGWGVNYEDGVAARLETLLKPHLKNESQVEVIDAGVPSMAPFPQLRWFEHVGCSFKPDLVIQFIYGSMIIDPADDDGLFADQENYLEHHNLMTRQWLFEEAKKSGIVFYGWMLYTRWFAARSGGIAGAGRDLEQAQTVQTRQPGRSDIAGLLSAPVTGRDEMRSKAVNSVFSAQLLRPQGRFGEMAPSGSRRKYQLADRAGSRFL
jgi:hypothetical protein